MKDLGHWAEGLEPPFCGPELDQLHQAWPQSTKPLKWQLQIIPCCSAPVWIEVIFTRGALQEQFTLAAVKASQLRSQPPQMCPSTNGLRQAPKQSEASAPPHIFAVSGVAA